MQHNLSCSSRNFSIVSTKPPPQLVHPFGSIFQSEMFLSNSVDMMKNLLLYTRVFKNLTRFW